MRSRQAWLAAMTAVLGVSDAACKKDATDAPAAAREVPSVSAAASAPIIATSAPSDSAQAIASAAPSVAPSATFSPNAASSAQLAAILSALAPPPASTTISIGQIGAGHPYVNPSCGATAQRAPSTPTVNAQVVSGGTSDDERVVQTGLHARLRNCVMNAQGRNPNLQGDVVLALAVDAHGAVTHVDQERGTLDEPTAACMKAVARTAKFGSLYARTVRVRISVSRPY